MRVLIQVEPAYISQVKASLQPLGAVPIAQVFDYLTVDIPEEVVPSIKRLPHVIDVRPEKKKEIMLVPIDKKLNEFRRLFLSNLLTGPFSAFNFSRAADEGKVKWPTSESRTMVGADIAEAEGITGAGVKVAVIDTGIDPTSFQLPGAWGVSSVEGQPIVLDENGHGTHCATTVAGKPFSTPYGEVKGVAPDAELGIFKALGYGMGAGTETSVLRAMMDAFAWGASIISMSLGSAYSEEPTEVIPETRVVKMLTQQGIIVVIANGNDGPGPRTVGVAACSPYALSVGAIDRHGKVADFSSRGPTQEDLIKPDVTAPGVDILSSTVGLIDIMQFFDGIKLGCISGTSMATPHVSGVVALAVQYAKDKGKKLTTEAIKEAMAMYGESKNNDTGWGLITYPLLKRYIDEQLGVVEEIPPAAPPEEAPPPEEEVTPPAAEFIVS